MYADERIFRRSTPGFRDWYKRNFRNGGGPRVPTFTGSTTQSTTSSSNSASNPGSHGPSRTTQSAADNPPTQAAQPAQPPRPVSVSDTWPIIDTPETGRATDSYSQTYTHDITARIERSRRPYVGGHEIPPGRPRSASAIPDDVERMHLSPSLEQIPFERRRRQYSISSREWPDAPISQSPPQTRQANSPPPTNLHEIVERGIDISLLPTSTLLTIMRQNNCPIPAGAVEKDDLVERVEEMASFLIPQPPAPNGPTPEKLPRVRDEDEDDCRICFERVADYCLVPCGHTGFCFMCARKMNCCPFCKIEVRHAQKLWKV